MPTALAGGSGQRFAEAAQRGAYGSFGSCGKETFQEILPLSDAKGSGGIRVGGFCTQWYRREGLGKGAFGKRHRERLCGSDSENDLII